MYNMINFRSRLDFSTIKPKYESDLIFIFIEQYRDVA